MSMSAYGWSKKPYKEVKVEKRNKPTILILLKILKLRRSKRSLDSKRQTLVL